MAATENVWTDGVFSQKSVESGLRASMKLQTALDRKVTTLVAAARHDGASWSQIGEWLGVSKQAAQKRYGR